MHVEVRGQLAEVSFPSWTQIQVVILGSKHLPDDPTRLQNESSYNCFSFIMLSEHNFLLKFVLNFNLVSWPRG